MPADTSLLLKFVPDLWQLLVGQQEGAPLATDGPMQSVAPDGQPAVDQTSMEGAFAGAVVSQMCSFCPQS